MIFSKLKFQRLVRFAVTVTVAFFISITVWDVLFTPSHSKIQYHGFSRRKPQLLSQPARLRAVRREFSHAWYGYRDHSWMADSLRSLSGEEHNQLCGWSATLVDTLDTLWIMGLHDEFNEAVDAVTGIDFAHAAEDCEVNLFESTIRYLGGMLAAYDLSGDQRLLPKLTELGNLLHGQFRTSNGMPCSSCKLILQDDREHYTSRSVPLADVGSFYLEFARLSQITGDKKYMDLVGFLTNVFESTQNSSSIPGLWPERVDPSSIDGPSPKFATKNHVYSLGALSDSTYEYLLKAHLFLGGITNRYARMWQKASNAIRSNLLFRAYIPQWNESNFLFSGLATRYPESNELLVEPRIQHLGCFAGGMYAMSGKIFNDPIDFETGKQLTEGCIWAYENAPLGIMPETVTLLSCPEMIGPQCEWNQTAWNAAHAEEPACQLGTFSCMLNSDYPEGFLYSIDSKYLLRPEAIESVFILYRITGDSYYRDVGWRMFESIVFQTRTPYGHASLQDVMTSSPQPVYSHGKLTIREMAVQTDEMESFWLAETLKYFWLLFDEPGKVSLDDWVFNTEAHPFRLTKGIRGFG